MEKWTISSIFTNVKSHGRPFNKGSLYGVVPGELHLCIGCSQPNAYNLVFKKGGRVKNWGWAVRGFMYV